MNDPAIKIDLWKNKDIYHGSNNKGSLQIEKKIKCENSHTLQTPPP